MRVLKPLITLSCAALMLLGPVTASAQKAGKPASAATAVPAFPIAEVVAQVKRELLAAQNLSGGNLGLNLDNVQLAFALTRTSDVNGKASIGIPVLGGLDVGGSGARKVEDSSTLAIDLVPPKPAGMMSGDDSKDFGITQAIVETRRQLLAGLADQPRLDPTKIVITLKFVVTKTGGGTAQIKFLVFTLGGGKTLTSANSNTITLTFSKAKVLD